jgi:hypothetical protein
LLPFQNDKRLVTDYVENFETLMSFHDPKTKIDDPLSIYYIENDGWITDKVDIVV